MSASQPSVRHARKSRRIWVGNGRAHVEMRGIDRPGSEQAARDVEAALVRRPGVSWVAVNAVLGRVIAACTGDAVDLGDLVATIEEVEDRYGLGDEGFPDRPVHPADREAEQRHLVAFATDLAGLGVGVLGRLVRAPRLRAEIAVLPTLVASTPRVRRAIESVLGPSAAGLTLALAGAVAQGLAQSPAGLVVDAAARLSLAREAAARRRVWTEREPDLSARPGDHRTAAVDFRARVAMPPGSVERHEDRAGLAGLVGASMACLAGGGVRRPLSILVSAMPKATTVTREAFAAHLGRVLADRGVVPFDGSVLRRLDRVDTVVVDSRVLLTGRYTCGPVVRLNDQADPKGQDPNGENPNVSAKAARLRARVDAMLDPSDPTAVRRQGEWILRPLATVAPQETEAAAAAVRQVRRRGAVVLGLFRKSRLVAVTAAEPEVSPLADALVTAARSAGELVIAGRGSGLARRFVVDRVVSSGSRLPAAVRALQAEGRVVALVAPGPGAALVAADCGIGVLEPDRRPPWGADLLCGPGLSEACFVLDAIGVARGVSQRAALLATYGSVTAGLLALMGPRAGATERATLAVNVASGAGFVMGMWAAHTFARRPAPVPADVTDWHALAVDAVLGRVDSSPEGLSPAAAADRLSSRHDVGDQEEPGLARACLDELANPLTPTLAAGAGIAAASGSVSDAGLIGAVMALNALVGGVQRVGTHRAIRRLEEASAATVRVRRNGKELDVPPDTVVVGDIVLLQAGDAVPADCRIVESSALETDESSLTGESQLVAKSPAPCMAGHMADRTCMLYAGTVVAAGQAAAVVVATGPATEAGKSAAAASGQRPEGGVQARLTKLVRATVPVALGSAAGLVGLGLLRGRPLEQSLGTAVSLAVAAVPEGLPVVATVAQLAAARRLSSRNALVRNPPTIETLGRVDMLLLDKTGTLTEGRIRLRRVSDGVRDAPVDALDPSGRAILAAGLRASPERVNGRAQPHPTDRAVVDAAAQVGVLARHGGLAPGDDAGWELVDDVPFESGRGYHAALGRTATGMALVVKGAPEQVLPCCVSWRRSGAVDPLDAAALDAIETEVDRLAREGYRVLAVAQRAASSRQDLTEDRVERLEFLGLLALADQVRPTAADAVSTLRSAGVSVGMLTGDHPTTAESIAAELGILDGRRVLTGGELDLMSDAELRTNLPKVSVFARVTPAHKVRIVGAYQACGNTVAMVGDGTNDAPAIRLADAGIALGKYGTNAAREAADVVVTDDRIETITDAIVEGRAMWASVRESVALLVGGNLGEIAFTLGAGLLAPGGSPLNARQLLLVNLFTDILPALALAVRPPTHTTPEALLREGPDASLGAALTRDILVRAGLTAASATGAWLVARATGTQARASTVSLVALVGTQLGQTVATGWRSPLVVGASAASGAALAAVVQTPGVSHFFGCRPLGPVGWATALTSAGLGTAAAVAVPAVGALARLVGRKVRTDPVP
ncbi:cation-transporting P-type ATPase [Actinopolymorpha sp. B9G3]|uniref:cation-translocating P-type ATPase n=1 Tax=Actinopolymorpha sp. B9G3 TaxID=3158970 RepID=UPI0032D99E89